MKKYFYTVSYLQAAAQPVHTQTETDNDTDTHTRTYLQTHTLTYTHTHIHTHSQAQHVHICICTSQTFIHYFILIICSTTQCTILNHTTMHYTVRSACCAIENKSGQRKCRKVQVRTLKYCFVIKECQNIK